MDLFEVLAVVSDWLFANASKTSILLRLLWSVYHTSLWLSMAGKLVGGLSNIYCIG